MLEGTSPSAPVAPSSSRKTSASGDLTAGPATEMPSPSTTSACGQGFSGKLQTESCFQQSPLQSGNVYVQASPVLSATNVYVQGQAPFANYQACAHAAQPGHIDAAAAVPASDAGMPGSTSGSCTVPVPSLGKELLQDRARKLCAVPKSQGSKSKRQQFVEKHGFKKSRGGKCRQYFGHVFGRDP